MLVKKGNAIVTMKIQEGSSIVFFVPYSNERAVTLRRISEANDHKKRFLRPGQQTRQFDGVAQPSVMDDNAG